MKSPNPENSEAFDIARKYADQQGADLIFGTDPDSDRIGVVVKTKKGEYKVLNGNQTGFLLCEFILRKSKEIGKLLPNSTIVKTVVTTDLVRPIAKDYDAIVEEVLTGFKFIGEKMTEYEASGKQHFALGFEESYGYLTGTYARDKDAVVAAMLICEMAADYKSKGMTLYDGLVAVGEKYGVSNTRTISKEYYGIEGAKKIDSILTSLRNEKMFDYVSKTDFLNDETGLPKSNVLKYIFEDGWFAVRPSGTEPKIKYYFEIFSKDQNYVEKRINDILEKIN